MKLRAKKEMIEQFVAAQHGKVELVSFKSGWATIEGDKVDKRWENFNNPEIQEMMEQADAIDKLGAVCDEIADEMNGGFGSHVQQLNYKGEIEELPADEYSVIITCECGEHRFVKPSDEFQVFACKPCTMRERRKRAAAKRREKRQLIKQLNEA